MRDVDVVHQMTAVPGHSSRWGRHGRRVGGRRPRAGRGRGQLAAAGPPSPGPRLSDAEGNGQGEHAGHSAGRSAGTRQRRAARPRPAPDRGNPFSVYIHVPFCATRCGYCDFNTYTADEFGAPVARRRRTRTLRRGEIALARRVLGAAPSAGADRVLRRRHADIAAAPPTWRDAAAGRRRSFGLAPGAEVTTEANPESVDPGLAGRAASGGFTRISFGMQARCRTCSPRWTACTRPAGPPRAVRWRAGRLRAHQRRPDLRHAGGVRCRLAALAGRGGRAGADHVSAYSLIVEPGTRLARPGRARRAADTRRRRARRPVRHGRGRRCSARGPAAGTRSPTGPADRRRSAGTTCSTGPVRTGGASGRARTAMSAAVRWWNVQAPARLRGQAAAGESPAAGARGAHRGRTADRADHAGDPAVRGLPGRGATRAGRAAAVQAVADGLAEPEAWADGRVVLTGAGGCWPTRSSAT